MSERNDKYFLKDMLEAAKRAVDFCSGMDYERFADDIRTQDAVIRNIEIIGEAAKNVSEQTRAQYLEIPWKQVAAMRDKLIHHYFGVNIDVVWGVVKNDLPALTAQLSNI